MSRGFRICMAKGCRGWSRPSYGRLKLTLFSRFVAAQFRCCHSPIVVISLGNWINMDSWTMYNSRLIQFPSDRTKIGGVSLILDTSWFFVTRPIFSYDLTLSRYNFETEARSPKPTIFSESWVCTNSVSTGPRKMFTSKMLRYGAFLPKTHFLPFSVHTHKQMLQARVHSILMPPTDLPHS